MKEKIGKKGIKNRLFSIVLALAMVFSLLPMNALTVYAAEPAKIGSSSTYWKVESGVLTISGTGAIPDYGDDCYDAPWYGSRSSITSIKIEEGVTGIGSGAFGYYLTNATSVTLPTSLTSIGDRAFQQMTKLISVSIPANVSNIGENAFGHCENLTTLAFAEGSKLTVIPYEMCAQCHNLSSVNIPLGVTSIGDYAFNECSITSLVLPPNLVSIGGKAFSGNGLKSITIPASVESIGNEAFRCGSLTSITMNGTTPPALKEGSEWLSFSMGGNFDSLKIYVPSGSVEVYKAAANWKDYYAGKIQGSTHTHSYTGAQYQHNGTYHWKECVDALDDSCPDEEGSKTTATPHSGGAASCFAQAKCDDCGASYGEKAPHNYDYSAEDNVLTAACTNAPCTESVTLTLTASDANYSGSAYTGASLGDTSTWSDAGLSLPDIKYVGKGTTYPENTIAPTNVGTYTAKITVDDATAYVDFEITKADRTGYTVVVSNYVYNTTPSTPALSPALSEGTATYYYNTANSNAGGTAWAGVTAATLDTGTYYMYAVIGESDNYNAFTTPAVSFTVTGATLGTVTATTPTAVDYDGAQHGISAVTCATEGTTVKYGTVEGTYNLTTAPTFKDAGTHTIYYQVTKTGYTPETGSVDVEINKKSITATVTAANKDYDGTDTATVSASVNSSDLISGDSITITGLTGTFVNADAGDSKTVTVNSSAAIVSGTGKDNYIVSYGATTTANINKVASTLTLAPTKKVGVFSTLDTSKALVEAGTATGGSLEYKVDDSSWTSAIPTVSTLTAGAHTVYYRVIGDTNHTNLENSAWKIDIEVVSGNITVNPTDTITPAYGVIATGATSSNLEEVLAIPANKEAGKTVSIELSVDAKADTDVAHKTAMEEKVAAVLGNAAATKEYLDIKLNKAVNSVADGTIADTTKPLEIAITYSVAAGKAYSIIRDHEGTVTAFTQLTDKPTSNFVDGTFFVGSGVIYIYSRYFSDYMIGSISGHSVIFNTNGGNSISSAVVADGGTLATVPTPTKSGYNFVGWYTNSALSAAFEKTTPITGNVTLYAKWVAVPSPTPGNGGQSSSISPVGAHTHVVGDIWLYDHELSREGNKLRHKACVICGEAMNYEVVTENDTTVSTSISPVATPSQSYEVVDYVVVKGDWMIGIAAKYGMTLDELVALNPHISNPSLIYPGNILKIKSSGTTTASNSESQAAPYEVVDYIVKSGDWMIQIAKEHGMSFEELYKINPQVKTPSLIFPGDILKVKKN